MIDDGCGSQYPVAMALDAQRIASQESPARYSPPGAIAPLRRRAAHVIYFPLHLTPVCFAPVLACLYERSASWLAAWMLWC